MSGVDIVLLLIMAAGAYGGYKEGFLMELFSLLAILLGVLGGFKLMGWAMVMLADHFNVDQKVLPYFAFAVVFVAIVILVRLLGKMIKMSIDQSFLGRADQVAGAMLGVVKVVFMLSVVIWIVESLKLGITDKWSENSSLYGWIAAVAPKVTNWIGSFIPIFKDVF